MSAFDLPLAYFADETDSDRLAIALDLNAGGVDMMRVNLRIRMPDASDAEVDRALDAWLATRPGAERGDGDGEIGTWPRRR